VTGWIEPTSNQLADARRLLTGRDNPAEVALRQIGVHLGRVGRGDFDVDDIKRALAFYRAWEEL
jgi:hypothetical protein